MIPSHPVKAFCLTCSFRSGTEHTDLYKSYRDSASLGHVLARHSAALCLCKSSLSVHPTTCKGVHSSIPFKNTAKIINRLIAGWLLLAVCFCRRGVAIGRCSTQAPIESKKRMTRPRTRTPYCHAPGCGRRDKIGSIEHLIGWKRGRPQFFFGDLFSFFGGPLLY